MEPLEPPELLWGSTFYWSAFWDLSSCRSMGMSEGPIPWTAVDTYARRHSIEGCSFEDLWTIVRRLDAHYLKQRAAQREQRDSLKGRS